MEKLYEELWGKSSSVQISEFEVEVPQPDFYVDPEYSAATLRVPVSPFQLTAISQKKTLQRYFKVKPTKSLPPLTMDFILPNEYLRIEQVLEDAQSGKWANEEGERLVYRGVPFDYKVSGQPGSGMNRVP
ncbi:hypothetical protein HOY80DRAFT_1005939 [Tuber brumale]|nr:hypothetical protein HOY80DRAFT_1005939 [Tuber brumale]